MISYSIRRKIADNNLDELGFMIAKTNVSLLEMNLSEYNNCTSEIYLPVK